MLKKIWKILKYCLAAAFVILIADAGVIYGFAQSRPPIETSDAIIILGAAINTPALFSRSLKGLELYEQGKAPVLILSGGRISDKDISEAAFMRKVILNQAQASPLMVLEEQSHSTYENLKNAQALYPAAKNIIIVSDRYHMARAVLTAKRLGFKKVVWSSPDTRYQFKDALYHYTREMAAMISYLPKFLTN